MVLQLARVGDDAPERRPGSTSVGTQRRLEILLARELSTAGAGRCEVGVGGGDKVRPQHFSERAGKNPVISG
jgi:hypothetical protein